MSGTDKKYNIFTNRKAPSELLPARDSEGHKGSFGKVLLIAGSRNMAGAAILAARAAYRTGAGMVKVISPECNREIIQIAVPEALYMPAEAKEAEWKKAFMWCDCIAIGCGLGTDAQAIRSLERVLEHSNKPTVIDADALNIIAAEKVKLSEAVTGRVKLSEAVTGRVKPGIDGGGQLIMTPHVGELGRLAGVRGFESEKERIEAALKIANRYNAVVVAKSADTYVVKPDNAIFDDKNDFYFDSDNGEINIIFQNDRGNSGMATAGSGDVLAGCIAALLGQGLDAFDAAVRGVSLHALAGDRVAEGHGQAWLMAGDIADNIGLDF